MKYILPVQEADGLRDETGTTGKCVPMSPGYVDRMVEQVRADARGELADRGLLQPIWSRGILEDVTSGGVVGHPDA